MTNKHGDCSYKHQSRATPRADKSVGKSIMRFMSDSDAERSKLQYLVPPFKELVQHHYCLMSRGWPSGRLFCFEKTPPKRPPLPTSVPPGRLGSDWVWADVKCKNDQIMLYDVIHKVVLQSDAPSNERSRTARAHHEKPYATRPHYRRLHFPLVLLYHYDIL